MALVEILLIGCAITLCCAIWFHVGRMRGWRKGFVDGGTMVARLMEENRLLAERIAEKETDDHEAADWWKGQP